MPEFSLVRADDLLVVGVRWSGFDVSATGSAAQLTAGPSARLILVLPPQHIGEETSPPPGEQPPSADPPALPVGGSGATVPVWRGELSAPTRLAFTVAPGIQIPLTAEGVLGAAASAALITPSGRPGPDDTAIELPWRLVIAPQGRSGSGQVACRHLSTPAGATVSGLWRTRLVDASAPADATLTDAGLLVSAPDPDTANGLDPVFLDAGGAPLPNHSIPLRLHDRQSLLLATKNAFAPVSRLELSALGGTLDARAVFDKFEWEHHAVLGRDMHVRTVTKGVMYPLGHRAQYVEVSERIDDPIAGGAAVLRSMNVLTIVEPVRAAPGDGPVRRGFPLGDVTITRTAFSGLDEPSWTNFPKGGVVNTYFSPTTAGVAVQFPITCTSATGVVTMHVPLLFVADHGSLTNPDLARQLADDYGEPAAALAPTNIDLVGAAHLDDAVTAAADVHEVHALSIAGVTDGLDLADGYRCQLSSMQIALPALRVLTGPGDPTQGAPIPGDPVPVAFAADYLCNGATEDVLLHVLGTVPVNFSQAADRSGGLLAPVYSTDAISRTLGPIALSALPDPVTGIIDPNAVQSLFSNPSATLLGFALKDLLGELKAPPQITSIPLPTSAPQVQMSWKNVQIKPVPGLVATPPRSVDDAVLNSTPTVTSETANFVASDVGSLITGTGIPPDTTIASVTDANTAVLSAAATATATDVTLTFGATSMHHLTVTVAPGQNDIECLVRDVVLEFPPGSDAVLRLAFAAITFTQSGGRSPHLEVTGVKAAFLGDLNLLQKLEDAVDLGSAGKLIDVTPDGIVVHFSLPIPSIGAGAFVMCNMAFNAQIRVPFTPDPPMSITLGFAARRNPFELAVMMFGGTGYIELDLNHTGVKRFEAALEFGAFIAVDFVVASGEVHALGGVRFVLDSGTVTITGYLRIGGSLEILGLVSVSIELCLSLTYQSKRKALVGRATLVIEIDLTLWSTSVELDSGEWVLAGGGADSAPHPLEALADFAGTGAPNPLAPDPLALFTTYRNAFADVEHPGAAPTTPDPAPALGGSDE